MKIEIEGEQKDHTSPHGRPRLTSELSSDQRGWAKERYPVHYRTPGAKWYIKKDKPAIPVPANAEQPKARKRKSHA